MKNAPVSRGVLVSIARRQTTALGGGFLGRAVDDLRRNRLGGRNRNVAGLLGLGNLANEIDVEQTVLKRGVLHQHEISKLEGAFEGARRDATIEHLGLVLTVFIGGFLALDRQRVFLGDDRKLGLREAGDRDADAVAVVAGTLDIVGRVAGAAVGCGPV